MSEHQVHLPLLLGVRFCNPWLTTTDAIAVTDITDIDFDIDIDITDIDIADITEAEIQ